MNRSELSFLWLGFGLALLSWIAFVLAEVGLFSLAPALGAWLLLFGGLFLVSRRLIPSRRADDPSRVAKSDDRKRRAAEIVGFLGVIALCLRFYFPQWNG